MHLVLEGGFLAHGPGAQGRMLGLCPFLWVYHNAPGPCAALPTLLPLCRPCGHTRDPGGRWQLGCVSEGRVGLADSVLSH